VGQRTLNIILALIGLFVVAALALLGFDAWRAARAGPRWRRRLVTAGLALLGALGIPSCGGTSDPAASRDARPSTATDKGDVAVSLKDAAGWRRINATWNEADEIASGKRGPYPFDEAGKKRILAALDSVGTDADALKRKALLSEAEAGLVRIELANLTHGVHEKRPTEERMATCYEPLPLCYAAMQSAERLAARLPLLEGLATSQRIQPVVARKVLGAVEADLALLADEKQLAGYPADARPKMEATRKSAAALVGKLEAAVSEQ